MTYADILKQHFEDVKEKGLRCFDKAARYFLLGTLMLYAANCMITGGMVGPIRFIEFLYHATHFEKPVAQENPPEVLGQVLPPIKMRPPIEIVPDPKAERTRGKKPESSF